MGALELRAHLILQLSANEHYREISDKRELVGIDYATTHLSRQSYLLVAIWQPKREQVYVSLTLVRHSIL